MFDPEEILDQHNLDTCECGQILYHTKKNTNPKEYGHPPNLYWDSWWCEKCGVVESGFVDYRGNEYDWEGRIK